jgi:hypothetical protein
LFITVNLPKQTSLPDFLDVQKLLLLECKAIMQPEHFTEFHFDNTICQGLMSDKRID